MRHYAIAALLAMAAPAWGVLDDDGDGVANSADNCLFVSNAAPANCDTDSDGFGSACDGDFDQSGHVSATDFSDHFLPDFGTGTDSGTGTDMDCSGIVNATDFGTYFLPQFLPPGSPGPAGSGSDDVVISASRTSCVAPCAIHFDATGSNCDGDGTTGEWLDDLNECLFEWDFGEDEADAGYAETWAYGARSLSSTPYDKEQDTGFVAAHVYESAGTYTAVLDVTNTLGQTEQNSVVITVSAWDDGTDGTTYCVANDGLDWTGCPASCPGSECIVSSDFDAALNTTIDIDTTAARALFRRGDTFASSAEVDPASGSQIGAFGSGDAPAITQAANTHPLLRGSDNLTIMNLQATGPATENSNGKDDFISVGSGDSNVLILANTVDRYDHLVDAFSQTFAGATSNLFIVDNVFGPGQQLDTDTCGGCGQNRAVSTCNEDSAIMGNSFFDMGGHVYRSRCSKKSIISHGHWAGPTGEGNSLIKQHAPEWTTEQRMSELGFVSDNFFDTSNGVQISIGAQRIGIDERSWRWRLAGNYWKLPSGIRHAFFYGGQDLYAINNMFQGDSDSFQRHAIEVFVESPNFDPDNNKAFHTSCYNTDTCVRLIDGVGHETRNNVVYAPDQDGDAVVGPGTHSNNLDTSSFSSNPYAAVPSSDPDDFIPTGSGNSPVLDAGIATPVLEDVFGTTRADPPEIGAAEAP